VVELPITDESFRGSGVPEHIRDGIARYINHGDPVGGFLSAFLDNELKEAFGAADDINQRAMLDIVRWFYNRAPSQCWGGVENRRRWQEQGGALGPRNPRPLPALRMAVAGEGGRLSGFIQFAAYSDGSLAMVVRQNATPDSEALYKATVFLAAAPAPALGPGECWIKTWSENEGVLEALEASGIVEQVGECFHASDFARAHRVKLTPAALAEYQRQREAGI